MAFEKITVNKNDLYHNFGESNVKLVIPGNGTVDMTKESFVKLLDYFRSYEFLLAHQSFGDRYYPKVPADLGYFVENEDGDLIIVKIKPDKSGLYGEVTFETLDTDTARVARKLQVSNPLMTTLVAVAKTKGVESERPIYKGIQFVDALPAETSAKRFTVYLNAGKYYTLNADEDALVELTVEERTVLPSTSTTAKEGVIYNLTSKQTIVDPEEVTFKQGLYSYTASTNTFTLLDLQIKKVNALPDADKASKNFLYLMTVDEKDKETGEVVHAKGTRWTFDGTKFTEDKREILTVNKLPYVELAVANTNYLVNGVVTKYAGGKFTKVGDVVKVDELPDVTTVLIDAEYIYTLLRDDGARKKGTRWVFDTKKKEFVAYTETEDTDTNEG